jgi:hypothetical protein
MVRDTIARARWAAMLFLFALFAPVALAQPSSPRANDSGSPGVGTNALGSSGPAAKSLGLPVPVITLPAYLPRYRVEMELDTIAHLVHVRQEATWTNPQATPTQQLVFNAHSHFVVPDDQIGFMAKTLEILRVPAGDALGYTEPPLEVHQVRLVSQGRPVALDFRFEGDTKTSLVVSLPRPVGPGQSVTVVLDETIHLPNKQGRWGYWEGVTFLSNWLPVFAFYGSPTRKCTVPLAQSSPGADTPGSPLSGSPRLVRASNNEDSPPGPVACEISWQPTPFIPWHQPFFNEAGIYDVTVTLPCDQEVCCSGKITAEIRLPDGRKRLDIQAIGVREFTLLCSARYRIIEGVAPAGPGGAPVRVRIFAFQEHEFYAKEMARIAIEALTAYNKWLGPYPWPEFSVVESYFGWNGNECSTLVMIDKQVFGMPHVAVGYVEYLVSHEICHQWWYNLVGTNGYCETWMDEAMANYFSHRLMNKKLGRFNSIMTYPAGLEWLPNIRREDYRSYGMYGTFGRGEHTPILQEMPKFGHIVNLFNLCYDKGGRIVGMIEERLGEAAFFDFIRLIIVKYRYRILRVADFQCELEAYTGGHSGHGTHAWAEFFQDWLCKTGLSDWAVAKVEVTGPPKGMTCAGTLLRKLIAKNDVVPCGEEHAGGTRVEVLVEQRREYDEPTTLGFALPGCDGYPVRVPIFPRAGSYDIEELHARVTALAPGKNCGARMKVEIVLPAEPTQIAIDPDQIIVDADPSNNFWHSPIRWRFSPLYTFLDETDLTTAYDRWNVTYGPWVYSAAYDDPWFTRSTMVGARAGLYRTQDFCGGVYTGYRTDFRDVVAGIDGVWDHLPIAHMQIGFIAERRLLESNEGDSNAMRAALWARYILTYGSSLYLPPFQYVDLFAHYSDNFLPFTTQTIPGGVRFDDTTTMGLHYRINYLTPYWDPEGGFQFEAVYEGGVAQLPSTVGVHKISGQLSFVKSPPNLASYLGGSSALHDVLQWFSDTRFAFRAYGATSAPSKGEFFSMGSDTLFRGFDMAQREGSSVWVGSVEWRVPLARRLEIDAIDHVVGLRNAYLAMFYDSGNTYINGKPVGVTANALGLGLRLDVAWFSFVERTTLRLDVAKSVNTDTGLQVWVGINHPF